MTYKAQSRVWGHSTLCDELTLHPCSVPRCPLLPELWAKAQYFERGYWKKTKKHMSVPRRINLPYGHKRPNSLMSKPWRQDREKYIQHAMVDTYRFCLPDMYFHFFSYKNCFLQAALPPLPSVNSGFGRTDTTPGFRTEHKTLSHPGNWNISFPWPVSGSEMVYD